ncbi:MAG: peptidase M20 [Desulfobulbaceae bacterium]|nr:MAG: peptidase M20 [Desulfobulbaceae bacterium]
MSSSFFAINSERLAHYFVTLCEIDSPGKSEGKLAGYLSDFFDGFPGATVTVDDSAQITGSDTGNLIVTIPGSDTTKQPLFFNCHMDVINPCIGVRVQRHNDIFTSKGDTVLGGDDKAGIAILMEMVQVLFEKKMSHPPLELLFTTGEEIGLLGAKAFDPARLRADMGFALDSTGLDNVIVGAPAAVYVEAEIVGRASHAGLAPEAGINALSLAAAILAELPVGKIDDYSTANIGLVSGGTATNIVPDTIHFRGEIRSHSADLLEKHEAIYSHIFKRYIPGTTNAGEPPFFSLSFPEQYPAMLLDESSPLLALTRQASERLDCRQLSYVVAGGGSDANIFNSRHLQTAILGIGMEDVHSVHEHISLASMVRTLELVLAVATV